MRLDGVLGLEPGPTGHGEVGSARRIGSERVEDPGGLGRVSRREQRARAKRARSSPDVRPRQRRPPAARRPWPRRPRGRTARRGRWRGAARPARSRSPTSSTDPRSSTESPRPRVADQRFERVPLGAGAEHVQRPPLRRAARPPARPATPSPCPSPARAAAPRARSVHGHSAGAAGDGRDAVGDDDGVATGHRRPRSSLMATSAVMNGRSEPVERARGRAVPSTVRRSAAC